jgi:hypothetical protein
VKCEDCLPRLEEYVDGELDGRTAERLAAHLASCAQCASEFALLQRDAEIYARYQRDLEVTPAHWNIVRARIEQEKDARLPKPAPRLSERLGARFGVRGRKFSPAFAAALLLIVIGITASIIYLNSGQRQTQLVALPPRPNETLPLRGEATKTSPPDESDSKASSVANENLQKPDFNQPARVVAKNRTGAPVVKESAAGRRLPHAGNRRLTPPTPESSAGQFAEISADDLTMGVRRSALVASGDFDLDVARHAERAEMLLRSFRNVRLPANTRSLDVSYEKEQSRKLLYQNIALRRDAAAHGDEPTAAILNKLEPILLDIANLPNRAKPRDVRSIEQQMKKQEIVATLQVRTLVAAN